MDWLVKYVTLRNTILAVVAVGLLRLGAMYYHLPLYWLQQRMYPPQGAAPAAGNDILDDLDRREAARVQARYRRVLAQLEEARGRGFDVSGLERKAAAAAALNAKYRRQAVRLLTEVEMAVPRPADAPPAPPSAAAPRRRRRS